MRLIRRILILALCALLFAGMLHPLAVSDITLTAVNDSFLPLSSNSMPTRKNGELYVPYTVFTGALGLRGTYNSKQQLLVLYDWDHTLNFSLAQGYVYDQDDVSYSPPAYSINGTVYVSVKLVSGVFGFSFSTISASYPVLRIVNENALLSDHAFIDGATDTIRNMVTEYLNPDNSTAAPAPETPSRPTIPVQPPKAEEKIPQPSLVYLIFVGAPSSYANDILNALSAYGRTATFFIPVNAEIKDGDVIRRVLSEGHSIGLSFTADAAVADTDIMLAQLRAANDRLLFACGMQARLLCVENGADALSVSQRDALANAGYRLWDATLNAQETTRSAYRAAEVILRAFQVSSAPAVVRMHQDKNTADTLTYVLRYMQETAIPHAPIRLSSTPINDIGETR